MRTLEERIQNKEIIILDGATGTELQRRGVPMDGAAWSAAALATHPAVVQAVHEDYIRAGADLVITNTFSSGRIMLERAGLGDRVRELNLRAVELARRAREAAAEGRPVLVAGSINIWDGLPGEAAIEANLREQADLLAEGGADLIALEMMEDTREATLAIQAALATGLPVWVGLSVKRAPDGSVVLGRSGEPLGPALAALLPLGAAAFTVMHSLPEVTGPALQIIRAQWAGPLGAYAHMGEFTMPNWHWVNMLSPEEYAAEAEQWVGLGANMIGGCCGLGPEYIRVLNERLRGAEDGMHNP